MCVIYREIEKEKMKEGRDLVVMALGTAHWGKSLKYLRIMKWYDVKIILLIKLYVIYVYHVYIIIGFWTVKPQCVMSRVIMMWYDVNNNYSEILVMPYMDTIICISVDFEE